MISYPKRVASWILLDDNTGTKELDKSVFNSNGTSIPVKTRYFFLETDIEQGDKIDVFLFHEGKKYKAFITKLNTKKEKNPRTQLYWSFDFTELLAKNFPQQYKKLTGIDKSVIELPKARFTLKRKNGFSEYDVTLTTSKRKLTN
jgi:hypothetical protein